MKNNSLKNDPACQTACPTDGKRPVCPRCLRAQSNCICRWIRTVTPSPQVLILQHPLEVRQTKGSGRLLHLSLEGSRLATGEHFGDDELSVLLYGGEKSSSPAIQPVLLYPAPAGEKPVPLFSPGAAAQGGKDMAQIRLVVLDATWRKSRKMLYLNPLLQQLPRLPLRDPPPSQYLIRKAHRPDQLSTLEAVCHALAQLEGQAEKYWPLLEAFDGFVAQQSAYAAHVDRP